MSDQENSSLAGVPQKRTLSAQRRLQNRVAQQRYRERQKTNAATSAEQSDVTPPNGHDAGGTVDAVDAGDGEDMYYQREHAFLPNSDHPLSSSLGLNHTPIQWHAPPIPSVAPSPQIPHPFDAALDNGMTPNSSHLDTTFDGLFGSTDTESHRRYFQQQVSLLAESNDSVLTRPPRLYSNETSTTPSPSSASASPLYRSPASSTSSMGQLFGTPPSGMCYKTSQSRTPLLHVAIRTRKKSMVRLLLRRGVSSINEQDTAGRTALHVAAQAGDEEMVETLIKHGANPATLDSQGLDALHYAVEQGHEEVVEMLLDVISRREQI